MLKTRFLLGERTSNMYSPIEEIIPLTAYLAAEGFEDELRNELGSDVREVFGRLFITDAPERDVVWAENVWKKPVQFPISSIGDGAKKLRALQPLWAPYTVEHHRRATLIQEQLPKVRQHTQEFLGPLPDRKLGSWTLLKNDLILASSDCSSVFPNGHFNFNEDRTSAPSRAYLKLWELFTLHGIRPKPGERCIDLGSCPGGWTWVLASLGCDVISVDKAPLDPRVAKMSNVRFIKHDAFTLKPKDVGPVDWLFSDIICYPADLYDLVAQWRESGLCRNFVCTIKFQGETDFETSARFGELNGSSLKHLVHNKHEITWWNLAQN